MNELIPFWALAPPSIPSNRRATLARVAVMAGTTVELSLVTCRRACGSEHGVTTGRRVAWARTAGERKKGARERASRAPQSNRPCFHADGPYSLPNT
ncbi:unnamed protein product, partial [Iphiclides podalirius]